MRKVYKVNENVLGTNVYIPKMRHAVNFKLVKELKGYIFNLENESGLQHGTLKKLLINGGK